MANAVLATKGKPAKKLIDVEGPKNGQPVVYSFRLPSDDWPTNLDFLKKKICKKFDMNVAYALDIKGITISANDSQALMKHISALDFSTKPIIKIVEPLDDGRHIIIHHHNHKYTFTINKELDELDEKVYDELLNAAKIHFKLNINNVDVVLYENTDGSRIDIDDWQDLRTALEDKEDDADETLHLHLQTIDGDDEKQNYDDEKQNEGFENPIKFDPGFHHIDCKRVEYIGVDLAGYRKVVSTRNHKVIMVVGQTGAGKTTLLNSLVNYIYNVQFEDKFRLKLIIEKAKPDGQAVSQTDDISAYFIKRPLGSNLHYDLTVIDTPGFGDTRGIKRDKTLVRNIKLFFENVLDSIDAICFVVKATDTRLSASQKYIFNSVLNLWGKDVKENIFILMTFADAEEPQVLDAINKEGTIADCGYFKLNNSVYKKDPRKIATNKQALIFDKMFWDMGTICFDSFFKVLTGVPNKSLSISKEVLRKRDEITSRIEIMQTELFTLLEEQQEIIKQQYWIKQHERQINEYQELNYYEKQRYFVKKYVFSDRVTTCAVCQNRTCCPLCDKLDNTKCSMMNNSGKCRICGCASQHHRNCNYYWLPKTRQVLKINWNEDVQRKHDTAMVQISRAQIILQNLNAKYRKQTQKVRRLMAAIHGCISVLEKIALRPVTTTVEDYIDTLIENEDDAKTIKQLKEYKTKENIAKIMQEKKHADEECFIVIQSLLGGILIAKVSKKDLKKQ